MIAPASLDQLLSIDRVAPMQAAIVSQLRTLLPGVTVTAHPGKVDLSELISRTVVQAPGIGIGWSRIRDVMLADGAFCLSVEWVAYIVAEARVVAQRRVEKEAVALAIGGRLLEILSDQVASLWNLTQVLPVADNPPAELKPLFTVKDASQGVAYYTVTWTQIVADLGRDIFPDHAGTVDVEAGLINYESAEALEAIAPWIPAREVPDDA